MSTINSSNLAEFRTSLTGTDLSLAPSESTAFTVTFRPSGTGTRTSTLEIPSNDGDESPYTLHLSGYGTPVPAPEINLKKGTLNVPSGQLGHDFGPVLIGTLNPPSVAFAIENIGTAPLNVTGTGFRAGASGQFALSAPSVPFAVQPGQTRQFTLAYAPASAGTTTESVIIANDDGNENPYTLTVRGTGQTPAPSMRVRRGSTEIPDGTSLGYDFGPVHAGASSQPVAFTIDNTAGSAQLFISELTCSSAEFAVDYTGFTSSVPAGGTTLFRLRFSPGDTGQETATLTISNNDPAPGKNPYTFNVRGTGTTPPNVELSVWADGTKRPAGSTISFGQVDVGSHSPGAFSVLNEGPESLVLSYVIKTDGTTTDFGVDIAGTLMGQPIPPGGSTTFTVTFAPSASGHSWCELEIGSNAVTNPYVLRLEGSGHDDD